MTLEFKPNSKRTVSVDYLLLTAPSVEGFGGRGFLRFELDIVENRTEPAFNYFGKESHPYKVTITSEVSSKQQIIVGTGFDDPSMSTADRMMRQLPLMR
jgi:hypothetical protein